MFLSGYSFCVYQMVILLQANAECVIGTSVAFASFVRLYLYEPIFQIEPFFDCFPVLVGSIGQWCRELAFVENLYLFLHFSTQHE